MNALRNWGVLPSDKMICEKDDKQFEKWYHRTSDLYVFGNGELTKLIYKNPKTGDGLLHHKIQCFKKIGSTIFADYERA